MVEKSEGVDGGENSFSSRLNQSHDVNAGSDRVTCYLSTKKGKLQEYALVVSDDYLRVFSWTSGKEKSSINLKTAHAKKIMKEKRHSTTK